MVEEPDGMEFGDGHAIWWWSSKMSEGMPPHVALQSLFIIEEGWN